jgi:hypothetical protein
MGAVPARSLRFRWMFLPAPSKQSRRERGQAQVEAALSLPLLVFLVLGTMQFFMLLQARIFAQYAAYKAVHAGSLLHGDCTAMTHAALVAVMPTITRTDSPATLATAFRLRRENQYKDGTPPHDGQIVELVRESPDPRSIQAPELEDNQFDQPGAPRRELAVRMIYWYRLKIPFADWVMGRMFLAHYSLQSYTAANPLLPVERNAGWMGEVPASGASFGEVWPGGSVSGNMLRWSGQGHYLFPIRVTATMRMMQPPRRDHFLAGKACPLS